MLEVLEETVMIKSPDSYTVSYRTLTPPYFFTAYPIHRNVHLSRNPACLPCAQKCASVPESSLFTLWQKCASVPKSSLFTQCTEMCICPEIQLVYPMHRNVQLSWHPVCLPYAQKCILESSLFTLCPEMCMCPRIQLYPVHRNVHVSQNPALPYAQKCAAVLESSLFTLCIEMCSCPRIQLKNQPEVWYILWTQQQLLM